MQLNVKLHVKNLLSIFFFFFCNFGRNKENLTEIIVWKSMHLEKLQKKFKNASNTLDDVRTKLGRNPIKKGATCKKSANGSLQLTVMQGKAGWRWRQIVSIASAAQQSFGIT